MFIYRRINFSFVDTTFVADLLRNFSQVRKIFMGSARNGCRRCVVTLTHVWRGKSRLHLVGVMPCLTIEKRTFPLSSLVETISAASVKITEGTAWKIKIILSAKEIILVATLLRLIKRRISRTFSFIIFSFPFWWFCLRLSRKSLVVHWIIPLFKKCSIYITRKFTKILQKNEKNIKKLI